MPNRSQFTQSGESESFEVGAFDPGRDVISQMFALAHRKLRSLRAVAGTVAGSHGDRSAVADGPDIFLSENTHVFVGLHPVSLVLQFLFVTQVANHPIRRITDGGNDGSGLNHSSAF